MDPFTLIAGLAGGIGSGIGGIMGANAQDDAAEKNWQINLMNYYARERERYEQNQRADEMLHDQKLGATDAQGNRTHFVNGQGWVVDQSAQGKEISDLQDRDQIQTLQHDRPMMRRQMDRNARRQVDEEDYAGQLLKQLRSVHEDPEAIRREMLANLTRGINQNYDNETSSAMRSAIRTGSSNTGRILAEIGKKRSADVGNAYAEVPGKARAMAMELENTQKTQLANLYNTFATRAGQMPSASYQPQNINGAANGNLSGFAAASNSGQSARVNAAGKQGGSLDYIEPNLGWANAVSTIGQSIGSMFDKQSAANDKDRMFKYYEDRYNGGNSGF